MFKLNRLKPLGGAVMKIPEFKTEEEEAQFWETHSLADYMDELEEVEL